MLWWHHFRKRRLDGAGMAGAEPFRCTSPATLCAFLGIPVILPWSLLEQLPDSRTKEIQGRSCRAHQSQR